MTVPPMPPSGEEMRDAMQREGYYEAACKLTERRLESVFDELADVRESLREAEARVVAVELEAADWRDLALKYGTRTECERRRDTMTLNGFVTLARDLVEQDGEEAIGYACRDLAKKLANGLRRKSRSPSLENA